MTNTADIVLFTVNEFETQAVWRAFGVSGGAQPNGERTYWDCGEIAGARVMHARSAMADLPAGKSARAAMDAWQPTLLIAVGIAWGADRTTQSIGDILVADPLIDAAHEKLSDKNGTEPRGASFEHNDALRNIFGNFSRDPYRDTAATRGKLRIGTVLSLPKLVDKLDERNRLVNAYPDAIGGEMEGRGMVDAAVERKCDWLLIKAICDWGYDKNSVPGQKDRDQQIAARNAADFVRYAVEHGLASYALHQRVVRGTANASASSPPGAVPMFNIGVVHGNVAGSIETQNNYFGRAGGEGT